MKKIPLSIFIISMMASFGVEAEIPAALKATMVEQPKAPAPLTYTNGSSSKVQTSPVEAPGQQVAKAPQKTASLEPGDGLLSREVFNRVMASQLPLSVDQIKELHIVEDNVKKAHAARPHVMPAPVSRTLQLDFSPGKAPALIRLAQDLTTTLVFVDSSGAPWNILRAIIGSKDSVVVPELEGAVGGAIKAQTNMITLSPTGDYVSTSISILLEGAPGPINLILSSGQPAVDMRVDILLQARGPLALAPTVKTYASGGVAPADFAAFLDGVPPKSSAMLKVDNPDVKAWIYGDKMIVRTQVSVKSPYVFRTARSADGTAVYEVARSSVVIGTLEGKLISINVSGFPPPQVEAISRAQDKFKSQQ